MRTIFSVCAAAHFSGLSVKFLTSGATPPLVVGSLRRARVSPLLDRLSRLFGGRPLAAAGRAERHRDLGRRYAALADYHVRVGRQRRADQLKEKAKTHEREAARLTGP